MDLKELKETPPWDWPEYVGKTFLEILAADQADASDRMLAAELAGDLTVIDDELVDALLCILQSNEESGELRGKAVLSLGPVLEQVDLTDSNDEDIVEAAYEAMAMAEGRSGDEFDDGDDDGFVP